jgi:hypothetical protein
MKCAEDVVADPVFGISALPVDPLAIARKKDILLNPFKPSKPGILGVMMKHGDKFGIGYSKAIENDGLIHFTVAHELGHYFLPGHVDALFKNGNQCHTSNGGFVSADPFEREADLFAANLLMPKSFFVPALRRAGNGFPAIERLVGSCKTSITATAIRVAEFSEDPCVVVVSSDDKFAFCCLSPAIKELRGITWPSAGDLLPRSSATAMFNQSTQNVESCLRKEASSSLSDWIDGAPDLEMNEDIIGLGQYGKTLTVLFTNEALEDEEEIGEDEEGYRPSWRR